MMNKKVDRFVISDDQYISKQIFSNAFSEIAFLWSGPLCISYERGQDRLLFAVKFKGTRSQT